MVIITWDDLARGRDAIRGPVALTIGTFDGVHRGHREILRRLAQCAAGGGTDSAVAPRVRRAAHCAVLTFRQHPRSVLTREHPGALTTLQQRRERFAALGATHLVLIDFSTQFSRLSGREFISALLRGMSLSKVVVGVDFRCGRGRDTDIVELRRLLAPAGVHVVVVPPVAVSGRAVSSTRIRAAVRAGNFVAAQEMMGLPFEVDLRGRVATTPPAVSAHGAVEPAGGDPRRVPDHGAGSDGTHRWYVAAEQLEQILPQPGTYAASVVAAGGGTVAVAVEVASDGMRCELAAGMPRDPLALRFHRRVATLRGERPVAAGAVTIASGVQE